MPKSKITIDRSLKTVWEFFTEPKNWKTWWGGELSKANPKWQDGATLVWGNGDTSKITNFREYKEVHISGTWLKTTYLFKSSGDNSTLIETDFFPLGGASFNDGGSAQKTKVSASLNRLKQIIESTTKESIPISKKGWWEFWK